MTDHHRASIAALLTEQTLALARVLVLTAEPVKAVRLLEEVAPQAAIDSQECRDFAARVREQADQAFSDAAYLERYTKYDNGGVPNVPFSDHGVLRLFRAQAMLEVTRRIAKRKPNFRYLSIGGGDGTIPRAVLTEHPGSTVWFSELLGVGGAVVDALQREFPGRVNVDGRYDTLAATTEDYFDIVECLEVAEHVTDLNGFLVNLRNSLVGDGIACISVPSHLDWIEPKMLTDFENDDNWYHHVRAFTPRSMGRELLAAGLHATVLHDSVRGLFAVAHAGRVIENAYENPPQPGNPSTTEAGSVVVINGRFGEASLVPGITASIEIYDGVLLVTP